MHAIVTSHTSYIEERDGTEHTLTTPLETIHVTGWRDTYSNLGLFLKASAGILVRSLSYRVSVLEIQVMRCHNHAWSA